MFFIAMLHQQNFQFQQKFQHRRRNDRLNIQQMILEKKLNFEENKLFLETLTEEFKVVAVRNHQFENQKKNKNNCTFPDLHFSLSRFQHGEQIKILFHLSHRLV